MRVTEKLRYSLPQQRLARLGAERLKADEVVASGKRINRPSDDPLGALRVDRLSSQERQNVQYGRNADHADSVLRSADGALLQAVDLLNRAREIAIQGINSSLTQQDADLLADELLSIREQLRSLANTRNDGRFVFGGFQTRVEPYDVNFAFQGDTNAQEVDVADRLRVAIAPAGGAAFGDGTAATIDLFANLDALQTEIRARDEVNMQNEFDVLVQGIEQVVKVQTDVGLRLQRVEAARAIHARLAERIPTDRALIEEADLPSAITEMARLENALQASLASGARLINGSSLLDYLR
jgi:flagellar hook-associated protein 3 FlgL